MPELKLSLTTFHDIIQSRCDKIILKPCKNKIREGWLDYSSKEVDKKIIMNFENTFDHNKWAW